MGKSWDCVGIGSDLGQLFCCDFTSFVCSISSVLWRHEVGVLFLVLLCCSFSSIIWFAGLFFSVPFACLVGWIEGGWILTHTHT